jgi:glycosyltransferase involved in cell wall biosynthesis
VERAFLTAPRGRPIPSQRAVFLSNPLRGLEPLLSIWRDDIRPFAPCAELHVFSGPQVYAGDARRRHGEEMDAVLRKAAEMADDGVVLRQPLAKDALAKELAEARVLLYLGDVGETFCLAVAEAQAMGVPAVVRPIGAVAERVRHGETGFVAQSDREFAQSALRLLTDDKLWSKMSRASMAQRPALSWRDAAASFVQLHTKSR